MSEEMVRLISPRGTLTVPAEKLLESVNDFGWSSRIVNCLESIGVKTLGDLVQKEDTDLLRVRNFGRISFTEVGLTLAYQGLCLGCRLATPADPPASEPPPRETEIERPLLLQKVAQQAQQIAALQVRLMWAQEIVVALRGIDAQHTRIDAALKQWIDATEASLAPLGMEPPRTQGRGR